MADQKYWLGLRSALRILMFIFWCLIVIIWLSCARRLKRPNAEKIPMIFHRGCCQILGLKTKTRDQLSTIRSTLYVANHISYLDIFVLGGIIPGYFIAKSEVADWPVLGWMATLQNTLFFERNRKRANSQVQVMREHLAKGSSLILFPEGTSTEGAHVEPFKSSLFNAASLPNGEEVQIQPVTIAYTGYRKRPMTQKEREYYAWYGTTPFLPHFIKAAGMGSAQIELIFHEPVKLKDFNSRKECALHCWQQIAAALDNALPHTKMEARDDNPRYKSISTGQMD